jgi:hypothetical protein
MNRLIAWWLRLERKHTWTHLAHPHFKTPMTTFTVMIHSVPTKFDISNNEHLKMLRTQNNIPYDMLKKLPMAWTTPQEQQKSWITLN